MSQLSLQFMKKIVHCLEEEEMDIYTLTLYSIDSDDMNFFNPKDRDRVRNIFKILKEDTRRHAELLKLIVEMSEDSHGKKVL